MSPGDVFTPMQLEAIRQLMREELQARSGQAPSSPTPPEQLSPPEASRRLGGRPSADTILKWIHAKRLPWRTFNTSADPKKPNYAVRLDEVLAALEATGKPAPAAEPVDLEAARARARERAGKPKGGR